MNCNPQHNPNRAASSATFDNVGENIFTMTNEDTLGVAGVNAIIETWGNERYEYDRDTNSCTSICGHYTQVRLQIIWNTPSPILNSLLQEELNVALLYTNMQMVWAETELAVGLQTEVLVQA